MNSWPTTRTWSARTFCRRCVMPRGERKNARFRSLRGFERSPFRHEADFCSGGRGVSAPRLDRPRPLARRIARATPEGTACVRSALRTSTNHARAAGRTLRSILRYRPVVSPRTRSARVVRAPRQLHPIDDPREPPAPAPPVSMTRYPSRRNASPTSVSNSRQDIRATEMYVGTELPAQPETAERPDQRHRRAPPPVGPVHRSVL